MSSQHAIECCGDFAIFIGHELMMEKYLLQDTDNMLSYKVISVLDKEESYPDFNAKRIEQGGKSI